MTETELIKILALIERKDNNSENLKKMSLPTNPMTSTLEAEFIVSEVLIH
jgi:hypothetical protein